MAGLTGLGVYTLALSGLAWGAERNEGQVTLTFLNRGSVEAQRLYEKVIGIFEAEHPNIHINLVWIPGGDANTQMERLQVLIAGGTPPDVFWVHTYLMRDLVELNQLYAVDELIAKDGSFRLADYFPAALNDFRQAGRLYGLPIETSSTVLYYNADLFGQRGLDYPTAEWDWQTLLGTAKKLTDLSVAPKRWGLYPPIQHGFDLILAWQNGGRLFDDSRTQPAFDDPNTVAAYQWIADLMFKEQVAPPAGTVEQGLVSAFSNGLLGMLYNIRAFSIQLQNAASEWDVAPVPHSRARANRVASSGLAIYAGTKHPREAWELVKFLAGPEVQREFAASSFSIPSLRSVAVNSLLNTGAKPRNARVFLEELQYGRSEPVTKRYFAVVAAKGQALTPLWRGEKPASVVMQEVNTAIRAVLSQR